MGTTFERLVKRAGKVESGISCRRSAKTILNESVRDVAVPAGGCASATEDAMR